MTRAALVDPMPKSKRAENPMDEENFPDSPTRRAADKHMAEPTNTPGSHPERMKRAPQVNEQDE